MEDKELGAGLTCFIVGPIGDRLEPAGTPGRMRYENATQMWENVFEPACERFGLTPVRADKITESGEIPEQIFTFLRDADVVIADLTGGNANVMYELGLRHTRDKITVQIGEHEQLPFDVTTIRTVKFKRTEAGLIDARNSLIEALRASLRGQGKPVSATRVWNEVAVLAADEVARASALSSASDDPADVADNDGPGVVDQLAAGEEAITRATELLEDFSATMTEMTEISEGMSPEISESSSFAARLTLVRRLAEALKGPASRFDLISAEYLQRVEEVDAMVKLVVEMSTENDEEVPDEVWGYLVSVWSLKPNVEEASVAFTGAMQGARQFQQLSQQLRPVSRSLVHSFNSMLRGNQIVTSWAELIEEMPGSSEHLPSSD